MDTAPNPDAPSPDAPSPDAPSPDAPLPERVLRALRAQVTPTLPSELAAELGVPQKALARLLGKMAREGSVRRAGGGRFTASRHW